MYAEIKLKDAQGDEKTVPMLATASTPIRFKMLYGKDLMTGIVSADGSFDLDIVSKLAYLMSMQAAKADITSLNTDKFIDWLDGFDSMAFMDNCDKIFEVYVKSRNNTSKAKK